MDAATIKLFLPSGDAKGLRIAEVINWTGKALAAPRTELEELLGREELARPGVYILTGTDENGDAFAYVGESECIRDRIPQQRGLEFWVSAIVFMSKDENLTKSHVRYLESKLVHEALEIGRFRLCQNKPSGAALPESDRADMEAFLARIRQLLPVLGSDILSPMVSKASTLTPNVLLYCRNKGAEGRGQQTPNGFVVFKGSTAVKTHRPSAENYPWVLGQRQRFITDGTLVPDADFLVFTRDVEFSSPSGAAAVIHGGTANGFISWTTEDGKTLRSLESSG